MNCIETGPQYKFCPSFDWVLTEVCFWSLFLILDLKRRAFGLAKELETRRNCRLDMNH